MPKIKPRIVVFSYAQKSDVVTNFPCYGNLSQKLHNLSHATQSICTQISTTKQSYIVIEIDVAAKTGAFLMRGYRLREFSLDGIFIRDITRMVVALEKIAMELSFVVQNNLDIPEVFLQLYTRECHTVQKAKEIADLKEVLHDIQ